MNTSESRSSSFKTRRAAFASRTTLVALAVIVAAPSSSVAGPIPDYGLDWVTIGSPGNRGTNLSEAPARTPGFLGVVNHEYRLTRTEITARDWVGFVNAFYPHFTPSSSIERAGLTSSFLFQVPGQPGTWSVVPGFENHAVDVSVRQAMRYCNWLHNGQSPEAWAFESGAYDTSTFVQNDIGFYLDQAERSPGAKYWIPSENEWVKGMYYDPHRYGEDQEGYWRYPTSSNSSPISGLPEDGGETNTGIENLYFAPVGQYPTVQSPWGLLDGSGSQSEWIENRRSSGVRFVLGSELGDSAGSARIDTWLVGNPISSAYGFRLASNVPSPDALGLALALLTFTSFRRERCHASWFRSLC